MSRVIAAVAFVVLATASAAADEKLKGIACRSVHLGYPAPEATAFYNEVAVESSADGTYFMACGWSKGYFGIQQLGNGKKLAIFSVWDPAAGDDPRKVPEEKRVKLLHKGEGVRVGRFGNEGTGGQSFFDYDWKPGTAYRFLVTAAADGTAEETVRAAEPAPSEQLIHVVNNRDLFVSQLLRPQWWLLPLAVAVPIIDTVMDGQLGFFAFASTSPTRVRGSLSDASTK